MIEYIGSAFRNLGRKHVRTILTILGIAIGVASVIIIGNISQCGTDALTSELDSLGLGGLTITTSASASNVFLNENDLSLIQKVGQVEQASPILVQSTDMYVRQNETNALLWGIDSNASRIISLQVVYGRLLSGRDVSTCSNVCLVDEAFSQNSYSRNNIVGKKVSILCGGTMEEFTVVGVVKTGTGLLQNMIGNYIPTFVYVPYTTIQTALGRDDFDQIAVKIRSDADAESIGNLIVNRLNNSNGTTDAFVSNDLAKQKDGLTSMLGIVTLILSAVGAVSLFVASLSIMTVMLVSVNERTREIGIKKAIGATRGAIMLEFMFEAILISIIGCLIGIAAGYLVSYAGAVYFDAKLSTRVDIMLLATGFAILSGTVFGVYPAYKASNLRPVDALRQE